MDGKKPTHYMGVKIEYCPTRYALGYKSLSNKMGYLGGGWKGTKRVLPRVPELEEGT